MILLLDDKIKNTLASLFVNRVVMLHLSCLQALNLVLILHLSSQGVMIGLN